MVKITYECDTCGAEIPEADAKREKYMIVNIHRPGKFNIELRAVPVENRTIDEVHTCKYCIVDMIVRELDDRPKER